MLERVRNNSKGFTLAEAMVAVVVLSIAAAGLLLPFVVGTKVRLEGQGLTLGANLASELMEKIVSTPYDDVISTYNGYSEAQGQVKDVTGAVFTDPMYSQYSRQATCQYVYVSQESGSDDAMFILANVKVFIRGREIADISRLISK